MKPIYLIRSIIAGSFVMLAGNANAQMVGSDIFLQGKYVEMGISPHGSYGATTSPLTYHSHMLSPGVPGGPLGFVADPDMDGWTVGTPAYMGDYFYPGTPFEGWEIQIDTLRHQEFNMSTTTLGANIAYNVSGSKVSGTWEGIFDSVKITQVTTIDTNDVYFTIHVTLTNLAVSPKDNIYYLRSLDPDNDQTWPGGGFPTTNVIDHQAWDTAVVSGTGLSASTPYIGLGSTDTGITALVYSNWPLAATLDISTMYNQTYTDAGTLYAQGSTNTADYAIGLIKYIPHLATVDSAADSVHRTTATYALHPANTASFTFFYSFSHAATDSAIKHLNTVTHPGALAIKDINAAVIKVYPNPSKDIVNISGLSITDHIALYDMMGRQVNQSWNVSRDGTNTFHYTNIPAGAYLLVVTDTNGNVKSKAAIRKM
jgi:hypothetical protein